VISENINWVPIEVCSPPAVRISQDGGVTWAAPTYPWGARCHDIHAVLAWGPNGRLWAGNAAGSGSGVAMSVTYSDNLGKTWSKPWIEHFTPPWVGCYPSITVDDWPGSLNYGTVYVAYNWLQSSFGTGVAVIASRDGVNWVHTEVPLGPTPKGYPFSWRFGYRIAASPDGSAWVSYYESDLASWSPTNMFHEGVGKSVGRRGFAIAHVHYYGSTIVAGPPTWVTKTDIFSTEFQSGLAVDSRANPWLAVENKGKINIGEIGMVRRNIYVAGMDNYKPSLAISGHIVFIGWHAQDKSGKNWVYYSISYDDGGTYTRPALVSNGTWKDRAAPQMNGVGLRENASISNGTIYYAYGDARSGMAIYMAVIKP
jgi:hypothetical protein